PEAPTGRTNRTDQPDGLGTTPSPSHSQLHSSRSCTARARTARVRTAHARAARVGVDRSMAPRPRRSRSRRRLLARLPVPSMAINGVASVALASARHTVLGLAPRATLDPLRPSLLTGSNNEDRLNMRPTPRP